MPCLAYPIGDLQKMLYTILSHNFGRYILFWVFKIFVRYQTTAERWGNRDSYSSFFGACHFEGPSKLGSLFSSPAQVCVYTVNMFPHVHTHVYTGILTHISIHFEICEYIHVNVWDVWRNTYIHIHVYTIYISRCMGKASKQVMCSRVVLLYE